MDEKLFKQWAMEEFCETSILKSKKLSSRWDTVSQQLQRVSVVNVPSKMLWINVFLFPAEELCVCSSGGDPADGPSSCCCNSGGGGDPTDESSCCCSDGGGGGDPADAINCFCCCTPVCDCSPCKISMLRFNR